jgi:hypothetical protein
MVEQYLLTEGRHAGTEWGSFGYTRGTCGVGRPVSPFARPGLAPRTFLGLTLLFTSISAPTARAVEPQAQAAPASRIEWLEVKSRADAFGGASFGISGQYEYIAAVAHGQLDPNDPANARIVDLDKAPRVNGLVEYETDVAILRPKDASSARRILFYDVVNRGNKNGLGSYFNEGTGDLTSADGAGNGFLMRGGYIMVWSGWQGDIALSGDGSRIGTRFPIATNPDGSAITGPSREEIIFDNTTNPGTMPLLWPTATRDPSQATLRVKLRQTDDWRTLTSASWSYIDDKSISIDRPADMDAGAIYEFIYTARDPMVMGIGFAAIRDVVTFLKYATADDRGNPNPLNDLRQAPCELRDASDSCPLNPSTTVDASIMEGISQSGRFVRDFLWQGFNTDVQGRKLFDGAMPLIAGSRKTWTNFRFAQPGRWSKQHEDHLQAGDQFPFTYATITDPISGMRDGILAQCSTNDTCPKVVHLDGSGEFWLGRASLVVSDGAGSDVALPDNVRAYLMTGPPHGYNQTGVSTRAAACKFGSNIVNAGASGRATFQALVDWVVRGTEPPASRFPTLSNGLADPDVRSAVGFPDLSPIGVNFTGVHNFLHLTNYSVVPPVVDLASRYRVMIPRTDSDGNEMGGIRSPDMTVPLGTHTSWNPRAPGFAEGDQCTSQGSFIPFAATAAERASTGDPRLSLAERYSSKADYVARVRTAASTLRDQRLMLQEDVDRWVRRAEAQTALP